ncbi:MAG: Wzt carbohydrate-binding domain-containing protein [Pirellulaceae bacterium]|jgi:hypothetical protein|nr:Wzt carbohydrate-binding domain-containing protein [Pirellulaceae bacterium]
MSSTAIRVEGISKVFRLGESHARDYRTLRESLSEFAKNSLRRRLGNRKWSHAGEPDKSSIGRELFWALSDISFEVNQGDIPADVERITNHRGRINRLAIYDQYGEPLSKLHFGQSFRVNFECEIFEEVFDGLFEVSVSTMDGIHVLIATTIDGGLPPKRLARGQHSIGVVLSNVLLPREYVIDVGVHQSNGETIDYVPRACAMEVMRVGLRGDDDYPWQSVRGHVRAVAQWDPLNSLR